LTSENLKNTLNDSIDQLIENENINTQIETINLQESLDEVLISINSLVHDSKAIIKVIDAFEVDFNKAYMKVFS
jgi:hypothetical protein